MEKIIRIINSQLYSNGVYTFGNVLIRKQLDYKQ